MRQIQGKESSYFLDWEAVEVPNQKRTRLLNLFQPWARESPPPCCCEHMKIKLDTTQRQNTLEA